MVNRFLLIGAGVLLGGGMFAFGYIREVEAARTNTETVISLNAENAAIKESEALQQKPTPLKGTVIYACPDGRAFAVSYDTSGGRAALTLDGDTMVLDPVFVSSGGQFTDGHYTFRADGEIGAVVLGEEIIHGNCHVSHEATAAQAAGSNGG